jgi:hypothetical protein
LFLSFFFFSLLFKQVPSIDQMAAFVVFIIMLMTSLTGGYIFFPHLREVSALSSSAIDFLLSWRPSLSEFTSRVDGQHDGRNLAVVGGSHPTLRRGMGIGKGRGSPSSPSQQQQQSSSSPSPSNSLLSTGEKYRYKGKKTTTPSSDSSSGSSSGSSSSSSSVSSHNSNGAMLDVQVRSHDKAKGKGKGKGKGKEKEKNQSPQQQQQHSGRSHSRLRATNKNMKNSGGRSNRTHIPSHIENNQNNSTNYKERDNLNIEKYLTGLRERDGQNQQVLIDVQDIASNDDTNQENER